MQRRGVNSRRTLTTPTRTGNRALVVGWIIRCDNVLRLCWLRLSRVPHAQSYLLQTCRYSLIIAPFPIPPGQFSGTNSRFASHNNGSIHGLLWSLISFILHLKTGPERITFSTTVQGFFVYLLTVPWLHWLNWEKMFHGENFIVQTEDSRGRKMNNVTNHELHETTSQHTLVGIITSLGIFKADSTHWGCPLSSLLGLL